MFWPALYITLICLAMPGLQGWTEWDARMTLVRQTEASLGNLAGSLARDAEDTIEVADTAVAGMVERLETEGASPDTFKNVNRDLRGRLEQGSGIRWLAILDADGNPVASSMPANTDDATDRAYFQHHAGNPDRGLFLGPPVQSGTTGQWIFTVSRRFRDTSGGFAGVVVAAIEPAHLVDRYSATAMGPDSFISLFTTEGRLLARYPPGQRDPGKDVSGAMVFAKLRGQPAGSFETEGFINGVIGGFHRGNRYPVVLVAATAREQALGAWRDDAVANLTITMVLSCAAGLIGRRLMRRLRRGQAAEARLGESEELSRLLLHSESVTEALYLLDPEGNVETWSAAAERIAGYSAREIVGQNFKRFYTPEDVANGEPARILACADARGRFVTEAWRVRKDGSRFLARVAIDAIRRPDGTLRGFVKVTLDITQQRIDEAQRAIIIEAAPNGMMIVDETGRISLCNSEVERIFDYPPGSLAGQPVEILVPEAFRTAHGALRSAFTSGRSDRGMAPQRQFTGRKRTGVSVTIEIMLSPVKTPRGRIVVASLFDVTDRVREAEERQEAATHERELAAAVNTNLGLMSQQLSTKRDQAEQANQAKSRFLAGMTHELRTPLHGILGYAELLTMEGDLNPKQSQRLEVMMASGQHLLDMINAVLDISQIDADQLELHPIEIDLLELVETCLNVVRPAAEAKKLSLTLGPAVPLLLFADPTRVRQVLINLLGNAVKFTPSGSIEVRVQQIDAGTRMRLEVVDSGPGIWLRHREKLFRAFERLNANAVSAIEGAGLGLAIAARLVRLMDGQIGYADNPLGGSVFWFEIPVGNTVELDVAASVPSVMTNERHLRILVADDEALNRSIASNFLIKAGHDVICVEDGLEAVQAATTGDFDVILMDVRMPGMNGMDATRQIRSLPAPRGTVRVVAVTAQAFAQQIELFRQAGMDSHVSKPFKQAVLLAALQGAEDPAARAATLPSTPADPAAGILSDLPTFDRATFDDATACLDVVEREEYILVLERRCEALMQLLCAPGVLANTHALAEDAHRLAGSAGTFGFLAVSAAARAFEFAAERDSAETHALGDRLVDVIRTSLTFIRRELAIVATAVI